MASVLNIVQDEVLCSAMSNMVRELGYESVSTSTLEEGIRRVSEKSFDIVLLDVRMPDRKGLEILPLIHAAPSSPEVIIVTGSGDPDGAELAIKNGAWDYVRSSGSAHEIALTLKRALQYREDKLNRKVAIFPRNENFKGLIGSGPKIQDCLDMVERAAGSEANVLISGETGSGKELIAWAIYYSSKRANKSFVVVDCAALPATLVESIIFGHEKGAYTGADRAGDGLIRQADQGVLFLDEVGDLPLSAQKAFLRVLEGHSFRTVGGKKEIKSDFRVIAATNRNLEEMVGSKSFRDDLLFRLRELMIEVPPLREHPEDIREIADYHLEEICLKYEIKRKTFSSDFFDYLEKYPWPGNVRELINALKSAVTAAGSEPVIYPKHLPVYLRVKLARLSFAGPELPEKPVPEEPVKSGAKTKEFPRLSELRENMVSELERTYLKDLVALTRGDLKEAVRISGLSRSRFYYLLKKHSILS
ncbi:MAG: sigma-54 dependent transcriptional regulator [bacterium]|nr:sigma-54 dependent transcriptional regulator [bacterium]